MRRWRYLVAACAIGAAVALFAYVFAVRAIGLNHGLRSPYTIAGILAILAARRLSRGDVDETWPRTALVIGCGVLGAALASGVVLLVDPPLALRSFHTRHLPGFTVDVLDGHEQLSGREYSSGALTVEIDRDAGVIVGWIPGDASRQQLEQVMAGEKVTLGRHVQSTRIGAVDGHDTGIMELEGDAMAYVAMAPCDGRAVFVVSFGVGERIHTRVMRSIACKPEAHAPEDVGVILDPAGLAVAEKSDGLVFYGGPGAMLGATMVPSIVGPGDLRDGAMAMLSTQGFADLHVETTTPDTVAFTANIKGTSGRGFVRELGCGHRGALIMSFATEQAAAGVADQLAKSVAAARCREVTEPEPPRSP